MPKEKVPFTPSQNKRHEVSADIYSRTRLRFMRDLHQQLLDTTPFEIGCVIFGSLAKGKKLDKKTEGSADVDAFFYVDSDSVEQYFNNEKTPSTLKQRYYFYVGRWDLAFGTDPSQFDFSQVKDNNEIKLTFTEKHMVTAIKKFTSENIQKYNYTMVHPPEAFVFPIAREGEFSILDMINRYEEAVKAGDEYHQKHWALRFSVAFQLDLGGHLKKYRQAFIDQLDKMDPVEADRLWGIVNATIREWERQNTIPEKLEPQFPDTFEKAKTYYKPPHKV